MLRALALVFCAASPVAAETLVAARTIRPQDILAPSDIVAVARTVPGALSDPAEAIGQEARIAIYAGRPIRAGDLGPPAVVQRNALVILRYEAHGLNIAAEGRALERGAAGDLVKVMNLASRAIVIGQVSDNGAVYVSNFR